MTVEAVGLRERGNGRMPRSETDASPRPCTLDLIARAVAACTGQFVSAEGVRHRAVALGLLRFGEEEPSPALSCRSASRLLVAGYRLPAYVASASLKILRAHLRLGRRVLVPLSGLKKDDAGPLLYQLHKLRLRETSCPSVSLADPESPSVLLHLSLEQFIAAWAGAGEWFFVSVRGWEEISRGSRSFFGGVRDLDGTFHWDVAEIATDSQGQIVRC